MELINSTNYIYDTVEYTVHFEKETTNLSPVKWTFDWTVRNFRQLLVNKNISGVRTKKPSEIPPGETKFQLKMHFLGRKRDLIEVYCLSPTPVVLNLLLTSLDNMQRELEFRESAVATEKNSYTVDVAYKWYYITTLFKTKYENIADYNTNIISLLRDGALYLRFKFTVTNNPEVNQNVLPIELINDFESLLNESTFSDVVIKSIDDQVFKAHKAVLGSRCAVLKAHFEHDTTESVTNIVESPFESEVLQEIIFFIYTDKIPKINEIPEKLLAAADYYQLNQMKSLCEKVLIKKLTIENAIDTLQLADLYSATTLKQMTFDFIRDEDGPQLKALTKTKGWANVESANLIKMICEHIAAEGINEDNITISN